MIGDYRRCVFNRKCIRRKPVKMESAKKGRFKLKKIYGLREEFHIASIPAKTDMYKKWYTFFLIIPFS